MSICGRCAPHSSCGEPGPRKTPCNGVPRRYVVGELCYETVVSGTWPEAERDWLLTGTTPMKRTYASIAAALLATFAKSATSQSVRGIVLDPGNRPVAGVVVQLFDSTAEVARALTNEAGEFRVAARGAGSFRLRTMRIGYRPFTSDAIALRLGENATKQLVLSNILIALDTIKVSDRSSCRGFSDSAAATFAVWEQIRTAITATQLTAASRAIAATTVAYERSLDPNGRRVLRQATNVSSDYVKQPWRTIAPDALHRDGFITTTKDNVTNYYAPGLDMLLSSSFLEDHCFRLTTDHNKLGIAFEPISDRKKIPEIRGTMWLDRKSAELRSLEYRYENVPAEQADEARGDMEFARLKNGGWAITKWSIRMPVLENRVTSQSFGGVGLRLTGIEVAGGELALLRLGSDTLWSRVSVTMAGVIVDSVSKKPVADATIELSGTGLAAASDARGKFEISNILPGEYTAAIRTKSLDSINAAYQTPLTFVSPDSPVELRVPTASQLEGTICAGKPLSSPGVIIGTARVVGDTAIAHTISVVAEWKDAGATTDPMRRVETRADKNGLFRLCGVPLHAKIDIRATSGDKASSGLSAQIEPPSHFLRVALVVDRTTPRPTLASADTSSSGRPAVTLDSVVVRERGVNPRLREVEENKRLGLGQFFTRADLEKRRGRRLDDLLSELRGTVLIRAAGANAYLATKRQVNFCPMGMPTTAKCIESHHLVWMVGSGSSHPGAVTACYSQIWFDDHLMNSEHPAEPVELAPLNLESVESMEYYDGITATPSKYSREGSECGVLVIHTRKAN
jgi:hypothetical protein